MNLKSRSALVVIVLAVAILALPMTASATDYLLIGEQTHNGLVHDSGSGGPPSSGAKWGPRQNDAAAAAGGTVIWSHAPTGLAAVSSDDPAFLQEAQASGAFRIVAPDQVVQWQPDVSTQAITPGDETFFPLQWNMQSIEAPAAWATGCTGAGVRVAINDGGIYDLHPDIAPNLDSACSVSFVDGQPFNNDTGFLWHGTHVAGIVAAADNGFGVIGVAPEATLVGVKVLHGGSGSFGAVIGGILYAADPAAFDRPDCAPADIINMSLGLGFGRNGTFFTPDGPVFIPGAGAPLVSSLAQAVNYAASKGTLVISAAGNDTLDLGQFFDVTFVPCESGSGLCVSATGPVDFANGGTNFRRPASYSNFGEGTIDVAAPGGDFTLAPFGAWFLDMVLSTCRATSTPPNFSFCFTAGTSMASPAAAGVAALIKSANPGISLGALKAKLQQTADDEGPIGHDEFYGHGFVNAFNACTQ